ncbi:hypothetical protein ONS95_007643 [Cadophora gregata]|uniref:uncharacterized protein n=1 Tax=Cadophora gregata TaxID=51156 RepID=UPI0026DB1529|nr:uncharacterized protein ONS95_007643 [Cadophora gregata]KAK0118761.1 hypothetical protein ONS96_011846 [Cadophora gregata f. sp. sojae]KAK0126022.1 hypothetical protein ONS95_007643 [Cadophora gregata]
MEPMDYTMDDAVNHGARANNAASRYQCQQSSPAAQNGVSNQSRDGSHFDPVHDASNYYYGFPGNAPGRFPHTTSFIHQMQHWDASPSIPRASWRTYGDMSRPTPSQVGLGRTYGEMSWGPRAFGRAEDVYGPFSNQLNGHNMPSENSMVPGGHLVGGIASQPPALRPSPFALNFEQQIPDLPSPADSSHHRVSSLGSGRTNTHRHQTPSQSFPEPPPYLRYQRAPRAPLSRPTFSESAVADRRSWADSDEESISDLENEAVRREMASYRESDDEHALIMQGAMAAGRRMMAKEAFNSLEKIKVEDLPMQSRDCTICYNDFGVENPDGVVEQPVRWPKCKHLFGDKCIRRWFDEGKDTCPYCREKIPSELAAKRLGMESQMRMLQRRRMMQATSVAQQVRHGVPPTVGFFPDDPTSGRTPSTPFSRPQDEYEAIVSHTAENWSYSSPNRYSSGESPERRRQGRGRIGMGRSGHPIGRPVSIGSARSVSQPFSFHHNAPQRGLGLPVPLLHTPASARRSITPAQARQTPPQPQTPQSRPYSSGPGSTAASPEEASPPVAVGSGLPAQHRFSVDNASNSLRDSRAPTVTSGQEPHQRPSHENIAFDQRVNALQRPSAPYPDSGRSSDSVQTS